MLAIPALIVLFTRIHRYYQRAGHALGRCAIAGPPLTKPVIAVVPVTELSLLADTLVCGGSLVPVQLGPRGGW